MSDGDSGPPLRILLLEDSDIDAELMLLRLETAGIHTQVTRATHREEYLRALRKGGQDLILADYSLPDFRGLQALEMAQAELPEVPVVFVSGVVGEDLATTALRAGAADYVLKHSLGRLANTLRRVLAETRERQRRRQAEADLRQFEILFRMAVEAAEIGVWDYEPGANQLRWDEGTRRIVEALPDQVIDYQHSFLLAVHPDDRAMVDTQVQATLQPDSAGELNVDYRLFGLRTGRLRWLSARGRRVLASDGSLRVVGTLRDISEQRRRDAALTQANRDLEQRVAERTRERDQLWNLSPDLMLAGRRDGALASVNPAWQQQLGWRPELVLESRFTDWLHPEDVALVAPCLQQLAEGQATVRFDARLRHQDGSHRWLRWSCSAGADGWHAIGRDVTDERHAADELSAANTLLRAQIEERGRMEATLNQMQRLEAVGQLTAGVAHDFNNLLQVVQANIALVNKLLKRQGLDLPQVDQRLAAVHDAARRGAKLTSQLLSFSRRQRLAPQPVDLNDTINGMRDLLQSTMGGTVRLATTLEPDVWPALVDPTQLELIVLNLAINARDAMAVGGTLTLATANQHRQHAPTRPEEPEPGDYAVLSVADTGSGMSPEVLAKAFEPFFTTKEVGKGSGLGLAQVFGFAKQSGGGVVINTEAGEGTTVCVFLPRVDAAQAALATPADEALAPAAGQDLVERPLRHKVLVVDDDPAVRDVTVSMLVGMGCVVIEAHHGQAALAALQAHSDIALMVADFAMPGMNGAELAQATKALLPGLPVLIVTGFVDLSALGGVDPDWLLPKPFSEAQLRERVLRLGDGA